MPAGGSAWVEAQRQRALADAHEREAVEARKRSVNYLAAAASEKRIAKVLAPLAAAGYHFLPDRQWPGSRRAQVDMVMIGPGGLFIVDTKSWRDVVVAAGRVYRDQLDVTDEFDALADLAWKTEAALAEIGLAPGEVRPVVVFAGQKNMRAAVGTVEILGEGDLLSHVARRGQRMSSSVVENVLAAALRYFPQVGNAAPVDITLPEPVIEIEAPMEFEHLPSDDEVNEAILEGLMAPPIEDWMTFLHPDQVKLVRRSFTGPSRIRGAAGTGKTVVGLHKAAYLARSQPDARVLVTTYVRTLPQVLGNLLLRLAPEVSDRIEFSGVHGFARQILDEHGIDAKVDNKAAERIFKQAWAAASNDLARIDGDSRYWKEEIDHVIKGRGLTTFEQYADCARTGRKRRLTFEQRRSVWKLYRSYDEGLRERGIHDFADLILLAEAALQKRPTTRYTAIVVDEVQDLSCAMVRMLATAAGDGQDALTLIGDGQQTIYPGGYTLAEAGLSVAGRGVVMDTNYRNTAEILMLAASVVEGSDYVDIEGSVISAAAIASARHGEKPVYEQCATRREHDERLVAAIRAANQSVSVGWGDIGVLCFTNYQCTAVARLLTDAGIPVVPLTEYDGRQRDAIKVGTVKRGKGLEFKHVFLPLVHERLMQPRVHDELSDSQRERDERDRRELFVGITRARDAVWVGAVSSGKVSASLLT